tara:strand:- start:671 stop:1135 length:465 start_codon:yes stop_codon:yes gene_type:complete
MKKKELLEKIAELEESVENLTAKIILEDIAKFKTGIKLKVDPFIPEYLGFTETLVRDADDLVTARIYTKDNFNIARHIDTDVKTWVVMDHNDVKTSVMISNMYDAIVVLQALGMPITIQDYFNQNILEADNIERREVELSKELEKAPSCDNNIE